jgi:hypothetical protein
MPGEPATDIDWSADVPVRNEREARKEQPGRLRSSRTL